MNVHISYRIHKTPDIEKEINHLLEKLRRRLAVFRPELIHLKGNIEESQPRVGCEVSLNLRLPSGQMAARDSAPTAIAATRAAFGDLLQQVSKHKALLRNSHKWPRRRAGAEVVVKSVPFEETLAALPPSTASPDDVRSYLDANVGRLDRFVERELFFREAAGQIGEDVVTKEEVLDEAVARALGDGEEKPERLGVEAWLYRLAIQAMNDLAAGADGQGEIHLEESARVPNVRASDEPQLQFHQWDEAMTEEMVIADPRVSTPEDIAASEEIFALVQHALERASRAEREAFILHTIEGFSVAEVSAITGDPQEKVVSSIEVAQGHLRQIPEFSERFRPSAQRRANSA